MDAVNWGGILVFRSIITHSVYTGDRAKLSGGANNTNDGPSDFCNADNISQSIEYINNALSYLGYGHGIQVASARSADMVQTVNVMFELVQQRQVRHVLMAPILGKLKTSCMY